MKNPYIPPLVFSIHGIRTKAAWQRTLAKILKKHDIPCFAYKYGYFGLIRFYYQPSREKVVDLFYECYSDIVADYKDSIDLDNGMMRPSIVVHSFGTYILGYCLLKYPDVKFDKVILCGSILPETFDWATIIVRDQVNSVLNEYGLDDIWAKIVGHFVTKTGRSGANGFHVASVHIREERYDFFRHSDYFKGQHISSFWLPFLTRTPCHYYIRHGHDFEDSREFKETLDITGDVIDKNCFGNHPHYSDVEISDDLPLDWIAVNPDIYTFLFDHRDDSVKGYINAMPVDDVIFEKIRLGLIQDNEIGADNILPFFRNQVISVYLMSIAIMPSARTANEGILYLAFEKLINGFVNKMIYYFINFNIRIRRILAVGWTSEGKRLCQLLNMRHIGNDKFNNPIYLLDIEEQYVLSGVRQMESIKKLVKTYNAFGGNREFNLDMVE
jgi:pimeloyl-ACP methyl ester carboxylesterase